MAFTVSNAKLALASSTATSFISQGPPRPYRPTAAVTASSGRTRTPAPAVLHAFDASDLSHELYNSSQAANGRDQFGAGNKFITPIIVGGKVFVGTQNGVAVFGLL